MKYASSIRYGGQLIESADCDYDSYKDLGLLCPECKDPVFLRADTTQVRRGKEVMIHSHFAHFPGKDPALVLACENRVKQYDAKELERRANQSREQRRRLFNRHFYKIMSKELDFNENIPKLAKKEIQVINVVAEMARLYSGIKRKAETKNYLHSVVEGFKNKQNLTTLLIHGFELPNGKTISNHKLLTTLENHVINGYDLKMHELIVLEAFDFLTTKGAKPILLNLFCHSFSSFFFAIKDGIIPFYFLTNKVNDSMLDICSIQVSNYLIFTPWVTALSEAAKTPAAPVTPQFSRSPSFSVTAPSST